MQKLLNLFRRLGIKKYSIRISNDKEITKFYINDDLKYKITYFIELDFYLVSTYMYDYKIYSERIECYEDLELYIVREINLCKNI